MYIFINFCYVCLSHHGSNKEIVSVLKYSIDKQSMNLKYAIKEAAKHLSLSLTE